MKDSKEIFLIQAINVIQQLEKTYTKADLEKGVLNVILDRYRHAVWIVKVNGQLEHIMIKGGTRAYLDQFSDYTNPLLEEMYLSEKLLEELITKSK
ncbi:hypothetical protein [Bacillus sp. JCM 19041]|uniref:hypothetical protein n=1 Tax=Bacillus sp. JCM 19041 TaxID=1460637 RepID=UPI0006D25476